MKFEKYQHVEKLGTKSTEGILDGNVYIFSKIDGTNATIYLNDNGDVEIGSRSRVVNLMEDNARIFYYLQDDDRLKKYFEKFPNHRLFGEWLVPHTIRDYEDDAWRQIYIFDVLEVDADGTEKYLPYDEYISGLNEFHIKYIPAIAKLENPSVDDVLKWQTECKFLMKDGKVGEGIVIKRYDFVNKFGETVWAKVVNKTVKAAQTMQKPVFNTPADCVENQIVEKFLTPELINKEVSKIIVDHGGWESKLIPQVLGTVWHVFIVEETFNFIKKFHNPKIDFAFLNKLAVQKIKAVKSDLF